MKKLFLLGLLACAFAGNPEQADAKSTNVLNFQGTVKDAQNQVVNKNMSMTFKIYNAPTGGTAVWTETNVVAVKAGFFNVYLGQTQDLDINFAQELYIEVTLDNGDVLPRTRLSASPFSFRAGIAANADTADVAKSVINGVIKWENFNAEALKAGGALSGTYPNPTLNYDKFVDGLPKFGIPGDKIAAGVYTHIQTAPAGSAYGDVEGSTFPNLYLKDNVIENKHVKNGAITVNKIGGTEVLDKDKVLVVDENGNPTWGPVPSPLNKLGFGTTKGQMFFWDPATTGWKLTHDVEPTQGQVIKYDATTGLFRWMDDASLTLPYINDDAKSTNNEDLIRINKTDGNTGNVLDLSNQNSHGQEALRVEALGDKAFTNGAVGITATSNANLGGNTSALKVNQIVGIDANKPSAAADIYNKVTATHSEVHSGVKATSELADANGKAVGVNGYAKGGSLAVGVKGNATDGTQNIGVLAHNGTDVPAIDAGVSASLYADATANNALYATGTPAAEKYVGQVKSKATDKGRGLYVEGGSVNNIGVEDPTDKDDAVLVVRNTNDEAVPAWVASSIYTGARGKTAIKTYGDIWANSAIGAKAVVAHNRVVVGGLNGAPSTIITPPATAGEPLKFSTPIQAPSAIIDKNLTIGKTPANDGRVVINGELSVTTISDLANLNITGNLNVDGNTRLGKAGDATTLTVNSVPTFAENATFQKNVGITGTTTSGGKLTVSAGGADITGNSKITGNTEITGTTKSGGKLTVVAGGADITGDSKITGNTEITGTTKSGGKLTVVSGGADITGDSKITGNTEITGTTKSGGKLTVVSGGADITGDSKITGNTNITGTTTSGQKLTVTTGGAEITAGNFEVKNGNTTLTGTLTVADGFNTVLGKDLHVKGNATFDKLVTIKAGGLNIDPEGDLTVKSGNIKSLDATKTTELAGTLKVGKKVTVDTEGIDVTKGNVDVKEGNLKVTLPVADQDAGIAGDFTGDLKVTNATPGITGNNGTADTWKLESDAANSKLTLHPVVATDKSTNVTTNDKVEINNTEAPTHKGLFQVTKDASTLDLNADGVKETLTLDVKGANAHETRISIKSTEGSITNETFKVTREGDLTTAGSTILGDNKAIDKLTVNAASTLKGTLDVDDHTKLKNGMLVTGADATTIARFETIVQFGGSKVSVVQAGSTLRPDPTSKGKVVANHFTQDPTEVQVDDEVNGAGSVHASNKIDLFEHAMPWGASKNPPNPPGTPVNNIDDDGTFIVWDQNATPKAWSYGQVRDFDEVEMKNEHAVPRWNFGPGGKNRLVDGQMSDNITNHTITLGVVPATGAANATATVINTTTGDIEVKQGNLKLTKGDATLAEGKLKVTLPAADQADGTAAEFIGDVKIQNATSRIAGFDAAGAVKQWEMGTSSTNEGYIDLMNAAGDKLFQASHTGAMVQRDATKPNEIAGFGLVNGSLINGTGDIDVATGVVNEGVMLNYNDNTADQKRIVVTSTTAPNPAAETFSVDREGDVATAGTITLTNDVASIIGKDATAPNNEKFVIATDATTKSGFINLNNATGNGLEADATGLKVKKTAGDATIYAGLGTMGGEFVMGLIDENAPAAEGVGMKLNDRAANAKRIEVQSDIAGVTTTTFSVDREGDVTTNDLTTNGNTILGNDNADALTVNANTKFARTAKVEITGGDITLGTERNASAEYPAGDKINVRGYMQAELNGSILANNLKGSNAIAIPYQSATANETHWTASPSFVLNERQVLVSKGDGLGGASLTWTNTAGLMTGNEIITAINDGATTLKIGVNRIQEPVNNDDVLLTSGGTTTPAWGKIKPANMFTDAANADKVLMGTTTTGVPKFDKVDIHNIKAVQDATPANDAGKVLTVNAAGTGIKWVKPNSTMPVMQGASIDITSKTDLLAATTPVIRYTATGAGDNAIVNNELPTGEAGQMMYFINATGGAVSLNSTPVANDAIVTLMHNGTNWIIIR